MSIFAIAEANLVNPAVFEDPIIAAGDESRGIVIMPKKTAAKVKPCHFAWQDLVDARLPLIVAHDVAGVRRTLLAEYPHATTAIDLVLRDLREGEPVRFKPFIVVGPPGNGKSRLIRRIGDLLSIGIYRFDAGSSTDGVGYGGTPRGWSESTPCIPARAVQTNKIANPIVMVDEVEKASPNTRNGVLWSVLLGHLDRETAARFRDAALDAELDLSWVSHVATANSIDPLPDPLKDRYRIVKVPAPRLADLPTLVANVVREIESENGAQGFVQALAEDELDVIAKAWQRTGFSIRKLQKIVAATLEARDAQAMRH
jgi:MoxR-like ATPase